MFCLVGFATLPLLAFAKILGRVQVRDERLGLASNNQEQLCGRNALITWSTSAVRATPSQPSLRLLLQFMVCFRFRAAPRRCSLCLYYTHFSTLRALYGLGLCKQAVSFERERRDKNIDFTFVYSGSSVNSLKPARSWRRAKRFLRCQYRTENTLETPDFHRWFYLFKDSSRFLDANKSLWNLVAITEIP